MTLTERQERIGMFILGWLIPGRAVLAMARGVGHPTPEDRDCADQIEERYGAPWLPYEWSVRLRRLRGDA